MQNGARKSVNVIALQNKNITITFGHSCYRMSYRRARYCIIF